MNRRSLIALPGIAAFSASQLLAQAQSTPSSSGLAVARASHKALAKLSSSKAAYKIPKSAAKQARYLNTLTALLSLTTVQRQQAGVIFTNAASARLSVKTSMKAARKALSESVKSNDTESMSQATTALATLTTQHISYGASANAAFYQLLTPDQQTKLSQFQS